MPPAHEDGSINDEPQFSGRPFTPDPSEQAVSRRLDKQADAGDPEEERARHSVFDEPATLPNRPPVEVTRDWHCGHCGYNLRGLVTGHACPECGKVDLYEPPREGELTYAAWSASNPISPVRAHAAILGLIALAPAMAVFPVFVTVERVGLLAFAVIGPALAETMKVAAAIALIDRRSRLLFRPAQIYILTLGSAVMFALTQNLIVLRTVYSGATMDVIAFRWIGCTGLHVLCTCLATRRLVTAWHSSRRGGSRLAIAQTFANVGAAVLVHGAYNAIVYTWGAFGYGF